MTVDKGDCTDCAADPEKTLINESDWNGKTISGCFYQQFHQHVDVFPPEAVNVTIINSNCDNCKIPQGYTLVNSPNRNIKVQHDLIRQVDWLVDDDGNPIEPLNPRRDGGNSDPGKIPVKTIHQVEIFREEFDRQFVAKTEKPKRFKVIPIIKSTRIVKGIEKVTVEGDLCLYRDKAGNLHDN